MRTTIMALCAVALIGCSSGTDEPAATASPATITTTSPSTTTAVESSTRTTAESTTASASATAAPTTTAKRTGGVFSCAAPQVFDDADGDGWGICNTPITTTTVDPSTEGDLNVLVVGTSLTTKKDELAGILQDADYSTNSVDLIDFDVADTPPSATLKIAVTTGYNGVDYRDESAWALAKVLATFWSSDAAAFLNPDGKLKTALELTVDTTVYVASYDLMVAVDTLSITSTDWLNSARQA